MGFGGWFFITLVLFSGFALAQAPAYNQPYNRPSNQPYPNNRTNVPVNGRYNQPAYAPANGQNNLPPAMPANGRLNGPGNVPVNGRLNSPAVAAPATPAVAPVIVAGPAVAVVPANPNSIYQSFEQLIRYEVALLTEAEITHATGARIPLDIQQRLKRGSWEEQVFYRLLVPKEGEPMLSPDMMVFSTINQLKAYTLGLLGVWSVDPRNSEQLVIALKKVNHSYMNAMSAVRFYLWSISDRPGNAKIYIANMVRYMNMVQQTILFLRNEASIQYQAPTEFVDNGIAPIQQPSENKPYPIYVPSQTVNPQTKQNEPNYVEGEVIAPNQDAVK